MNYISISSSKHAAAIVPILISIALHIMIGLIVLSGTLGSNKIANERSIISAHIYTSSPQVNKSSLLQEEHFMLEAPISVKEPEAQVRLGQQHTPQSEPISSNVDEIKSTEVVVDLKTQSNSENVDYSFDTLDEGNLEEDMSFSSVPTGQTYDELFETSTQRFLKEVEKEELNEIAGDAFRRQKHDHRHPELNGFKSSTLTADEKLSKKLEIKVNCSQAFGMAMYLLSDLVGVNKANGFESQMGAVDIDSYPGSIKCEGPPDIDSYINKRINKSDLLSDDN